MTSDDQLNAAEAQPATGESARPGNQTDSNPAAESAAGVDLDSIANSTNGAETPIPRPPAEQAIRSRWSGLEWLGKTLLHAGVLVIVFVGGIVLIGFAQRIGWIQTGSSAAGDTHAASHVHDGKTIYACPMHPQIRQNEPGKCSICAMELVPIGGSSGGVDVGGLESDRYICPMMCTPPSAQTGRCPVCAMELVAATSDNGGDDISVTIEPATRRLIGIQTATASLGPISQTIRTIGSIDFDESKLATISAHVSGRIEKLFANYVGVPVRENDDLALVYSPDLYSAQVEYLTAIENSGLRRIGGATDLAALAKEKLIELGLTDDQVVQLRSRGSAESRIRLRSPINGTVTAKNAVEGDYVRTGEKIFRIADLTTVWLMLDLYPDDAARIRFGQQVEAEVNSVPGDVFTGRVAFIDPTVDSTTRTVQVRVEMLNLDAKLKPGDYATARIYVHAIQQDLVYDPVLAGKFISPMHPQVIRDKPGDCPVCGMPLIPTSELGYAEDPLPEQQVVTVPRDAVLMAGETSVLYVETNPGRFEIRRVTVGPMTDDDAVILEGLSAGETVATHGNFLIDSQMQLAGNPSLMDASRAPKYAPGPLPLPTPQTVLLKGDAAQRFDRMFAAYLGIQQSLAADKNPAVVAVNTLDDALGQLVSMPEVPDDAQIQLQLARRSVKRMNGSLEETRIAFRPLSHALLRAANLVRGEKTATNLIHMYCPMVPGGGGDWMQADKELINPYWGSEMLNCGEIVRDMTVTSGDETSREKGEDQ